MKSNPDKGPSQRCLRVGESIRHIISELLARGEISSPLLDKTSVTITEVKVSPDIKNATVFATPLGGEEMPDLLRELDMVAPKLRHFLSKKLVMKYVPKLRFKQDHSFEKAMKIDELLNTESVKKDLE